MAEREVTPFLMFQGQAEAAMTLYADLFGGKILEIERYGPEGPGPEGTISRGVLDVRGQALMFFDSFVAHPFTFTPAISLFVTCRSEEDIRALADGLLEGGQALMPLGDHGFSRLFAWIQDRFGVSWQLNLA